MGDGGRETRRELSGDWRIWKNERRRRLNGTVTSGSAGQKYGVKVWLLLLLRSRPLLQVSVSRYTMEIDIAGVDVVIAAFVVVIFG